MSYLPRFLRDIRQQVAILRELKTCPLGAAASFGTSWPINRTRVAELLGFSHPTPSGADGIWSRGELELRFAQSLAQFLAHLAGISQDIIMLSSPPRDWLRLADLHVTGSSIMPQKRNPDFAEVTRARAAVAAGIVQSLLSITGSLPSGYNRDTQWTKYLAFDAADNARGAAALFADVFKHTHVNAGAMREACRTGFLNATDVADHLARSRRLPFRRCYRIIGAAVRACDAAGVLSRDALNAELQKEDITLFTESEWKNLDDPAALLAQRRQPGNPHPGETARSIDLLISEIHAESAAASEHARAWRNASTSLWKRLTEMAGA